jgi:anthranilate phosphoribosyltransferase
VLEALGVRIDRGPEVVRRCIEQVGVGFLFAPSHHGAMRHAAPVRRALGFRTLFNLVGPLTNPAGATHQLVGLYDPARLQDVALVLLRLGSRRALVVHGTDGLDELTLAGETLAVEVRDGQTRSLVIRPEDVGLERAPTSALAGGGPEHNAVMLRALLEGGGDRPCRDVLALNAAAALYVAEAVPSLEQGVVRAQATLATGAAARVLDELVRVTNEEEA